MFNIRFALVEESIKYANDVQSQPNGLYQLAFENGGIYVLETLKDLNLEKKQKMRRDANRVFELTKGFSGQPDKAMQTALDMAAHVLELTNDV